MKHPKAGQPVKISAGPLKGQYFLVTDFLVNQFQGKSIQGIIDAHGHLVAGVTSRGFPLDHELVMGRIYPSMDFKVLHDKELQVEMRAVDGGEEKVELPPNVEAMSTHRKPKVVKTVKKKEKEDEPPRSS